MAARRNFKTMLDNILPILNSSGEVLFPQAPASPAIIAGPCSVESESQIISTAEAVKDMKNVVLLRAGIWKPRTHPGTFEGLGVKALPWLRKAGDVSGLPTATEVVTPEHVRAAVSEGVDLLWIGARTSVNPVVMQELAEAIAAINPNIGVLVKNPVNPDLELWIGALQRLYDVGVRRIGGIHRGFSAFNSAPYRNLPMWHIPLELHRRFPDLPIIHDPSHTGGAPDLVVKLAMQAADLGFDGLMIETHIDPSVALSDGGQQLTPSDLGALLSRLETKTTSTNSAILNALRAEIDNCDNELLDVLSRRMNYCKQIGEFKRDNKIRVVQPERYNRLLSALVEKAETLKLDEQFMRNILELIHEESVRLQLRIIDD